MLNVDAVLAAFDAYARAQGEHDAAREQYDGWSWGYYGGDYIANVEYRRGAAQQVLDDYVRELERLNTGAQPGDT